MAMNAEEKLLLEGINLALNKIGYSLEEFKVKLLADVREAMAAERREPLPEWVTMKECAAMKGAASLNTFRNRSYLQPCCGRRVKKVGGVRCWHRDDVLEWLKVSDDGLADYAARFGVRPLGKKKSGDFTSL